MSLHVATFPINLTSSANLSILFTILLSMSLIKIVKIIGPNTDPCGTQLTTSLHFEYFPSMHTLCFFTAQPISYPIYKFIINSTSLYFLLLLYLVGLLGQMPSESLKILYPLVLLNQHFLQYIQ